MQHRTFLPADILLPRHADYESWSVIACDQFTSDRTYWDRVAEKTSGKESTMHMVVPEAFLEGLKLIEAAESRNAVMDQYQRNEVFKTLSGSYVYVEREVTGGFIRRGLVGMLDLDAYEFTKGNDAPIRASENTVIDRLPPRIAIRRSASVELPHVMVLIDDPGETVVEPLTAKKDALPLLYDFSLMEGGGRIRGWQVAGEAAQELGEAFDRYSQRPVQIVIGDGNHSLAAAKACWEELKKDLTDSDRERHPAKYALVELCNVYDSGILFEPIHRVVFGTDSGSLIIAIKERFGSDGSGVGSKFSVGWHDAAGGGTIAVQASSLGGMIGELQDFLEVYTSHHGGTIDYIHDDEAALRFAEETGNTAFLLPPMDKAELFRTVISEGVFPKKSFSIGHARDKRYYLECRGIR